MNKTNKKFKKLIEDAHDYEFDIYAREFYSYCGNKISEDVFVAGLTLNSTNFAIAYPKESKKFEELKITFFNQNPDRKKLLRALSILNQDYAQKVPCLYFDLLIYLMEYFNLSNAEKADVLAFFINKNINKILSYDFDNKKEQIQNFINSYRLTRFNKNLNAETILNNKDKSFEECNQLRNIISDSGNIIPNKDAKNYRKYLSDVFFDTNKHYLDLIISESEKRAKEIEEKKDIEKVYTTEPKHAEKLTEEALTAIYEEQIRICKLQRQAVQKLRNYLRGDMPIRYLKSEDLIEINKALDALNYSDEEIMKIQKNIVAFNHDYEEQQKRHKLKAMLNNIFNEEGVRVFYKAEDIVLDTEPIKNPFYYSIIESYNKIKDGLIKAFDMNRDANKNDEEYEMLIIEIMCEMDTLCDTVWNYKYSDFRQTRKRKEEEN